MALIYRFSFNIKRHLQIGRAKVLPSAYCINKQ